MIEYQRQEEIERIQSQGFMVKVIGVGGAGSNVLDQLAMDGMDDDQLELICMNTDVRTLKNSTAHAKVQIGKQLTRGLGAGGDPELGILASEEAEEEIRSAVRGQHMVFICTGIGGGTGSGAAPTVSRIAKEEGAFVVVFATMPFSFEGRRRIQQAETALKLLERSADALITFENDRMGELVLPKEGIQQAFANADQIIGQSVRAITNVVTQPGLIQIGMDDLLTALKTPVSRCLFGYGEAKGKNRAQEALKMALRSPLLDRGKLLGKSRNALVHVVGGPSMSLFEVESLMNEMSKNVGNETQILFGAATDDKMDDRLSVTIISSLTLDELRNHQSMANLQEADTTEQEAIEADAFVDNKAEEQAAEEEAARQRAEEEARAQKAAEEAEAHRRAEEEAARQQAEKEETARQQAEQEAQAQKAAEEEAQAQKAAEEEAARQQAEQEKAARQEAEQEEAARQEAEEQARAQKAAEEEAIQAEAEQKEAARLQAQAADEAEKEASPGPVSSAQSRRARLRGAKASNEQKSEPEASATADDDDGERARRDAFRRRREELRRQSGKGQAVAQEASPEPTAETEEAADPAPSPKHTADDLMAQRRRAQEELKRKREELERLLKLEDEAKAKPASRRASGVKSTAQGDEPSENESPSTSDLEPTQRIPITSEQESIPVRKTSLPKPKRAPKSRANRPEESAAPAASRGATPADKGASQAELQLEPLRGRFEKATPTLVDGENLDVPTFFRKRGRKG